MIEVKVSEHEIRMQGHAGKSIRGQDIVCAAVSALTFNLINSIHDLTDNKIRAETASGNTIIGWDELSEQGKLLVDSWFLGLTDINHEHDCIRFL